jgi:hypothetical protein
VSPETEAASLAERARDPIAGAAGMNADYSVVSLAAVDHYLGQLRAAPPAQMAAIADQVGCYFGEVLRRGLGAAWRGSPADEPRTWTLEFDAVPLSIHPVGMAAEAVWRDEVGDYDGSLHMPPEQREALARALAALSDVTEEYYYSLTGRFETIEHLLEVLAEARRLARERRS